MARFTLPRDLYHGKGALEELKNLKGNKAIVVVGGGSMKRFGFLDRVIDYLKEAGLEVHISTGDIDGAHPNTAKVTLTDANGRQVSLLGSSIGGGNILVTEVNGMEVSLTGQYTTLIVLHKDAPGTIAAVTEVMAEEGINICNFRLSRQKKGGEAVMTIELDGKPSPEINKKINTLPNIYSSTMLQPI